MGQMELEIEQIKTLPAFMGEVDVVKHFNYFQVFHLFQKVDKDSMERWWTRSKP